MSTLLIIALILAALAGLTFLIGDLIVVQTHTISTREQLNTAARLTDADVGTSAKGASVNGTHGPART